jgi:hypothetical protein
LLKLLLKGAKNEAAQFLKVTISAALRSDWLPRICTANSRAGLVADAHPPVSTAGMCVVFFRIDFGRTRAARQALKYRLNIALYFLIACDPLHTA